jgi:hypothetical protein
VLILVQTLGVLVEQVEVEMALAHLSLGQLE